MSKYVLTIDQGTSSSRCIVFNEKQEIVKISQKEITNYFPNPGYVEMDANEIWQSVLSCITDIFLDEKIKPQDIVSIGITNQRETTILWDKNTGEPVYNAIVWQSRQTIDIVNDLKKQGLENKIKEKTGLVLDPYFSASKIKWIRDNVSGVKENKDIIFGTVDTWLVYKMTGGKVHATDVTNASRTLLFNIHTLDWDDELLKLFDIPRNMLPTIKETSCFYGNIDPKYFFNYACPITCLVGDQQGALFGESCFLKGDIKNTYGTGGFMLINTGDKEILSKHGLLTTVAYKIKGETKYALEGSIFVSGSLIQWLRDGLNLFDSASKTEAMARQVDDSDGVIVVPAFTGLGAPYWNSSCKGAIFGLTRGTDKRHIVRASIEAMAYQVKDIVEVMQEDINEKICKLNVDGGATGNKYLLQFQADLLGIDVIKPSNQESTALGAARLAGLEVGFYSMSDFENSDCEIYKPQMDKVKVDSMYNNWKKAIEATLKY